MGLNNFKKANPASIKKKINQEKINEIIKCGEDPIHFMKKYLEIQHPEKGRIPFDLFPYQEDVIKQIEAHKYNIVLKSRQLGLSTVVSAYCLWLGLFHRDKNIILVANKLEVCKNMVKKIRIAWQSLPVWMLEALDLVELEGESVKYLRFKNGSSITALPTTEDVGKSEAASFLAIDEAAVINNLEECWRSLYSTVTVGGKMIIFSTPFGNTGKFYELWQDSLKGKNDFNRIELPWHIHPEHDQAWFDKESRNMDDRQIASELMCSFEGSGQTFFNTGTIDFYKQSCLTPLICEGPSVSSNTDLWIWNLPKKDVQYILTADVARGDAKDYSAFHMINTQTWEQDAEYFGKLPPDRYGEYLDEIGRRYNTALIINEKNSIGLVTSLKLRDLKYPNLYWEEGQNPEERYDLSDEEKMKLIPGFTTKPGNKPGNREEILSKLESVLRNKKLKMNSTRMVEQMEAFVWTGKRNQAKHSASDDLIMALAIGCYVSNPNGTHSNSSGNNQQEWNKAFLACLTKKKNLTETKKISPWVTQEQLKQQKQMRNMFGWMY